jgi:hypothetical protein
MARPETPWMSEITLDSFRCVFEQFFHSLHLRGAGLGHGAAVAGMGPQPADVFGGHEAGGQAAPLGDLRYLHRILLVGFGPPGQRLDLRGVIQHAVQALALEQEVDRLPVVAG